VPLDSQRLDPLRQLLQRCTARIEPESGGAHGSGFVIDDGLLLTCGHVVKAATSGTAVKVHPFSRQPRAGTVREVLHGKEEFDLALIDVEAVEGEDPLPAVALDKAIGDHIQYFAVGYPKNPIGGKVGSEEIAFRGHRSREDEDSVIMLLLDSGEGTVGRGLSGGPVMNAETGAVVALVQYSNATSSAAGGGAIPIARAAELFEPVRQALEPQPPVVTRSWRDALGQEGWEGLNKEWEPRRWVDLVVGGTSSCWQVKVDAADFDELSVRAGNLPDDVAEALFRWSQRRRIRDRDAVLLLGRLLGGAVFPEAVRKRILENRLGDGLLLRLKIDGESELFNVPWEFVTVTANGDEKYVAAEEGYGFVRVAPHPDGDKISTSPARGEVRVVGITIQPKTWQKYMPALDNSGAQAFWPKPHQIASELAVDVGTARTFRLVSVEPKQSDLQYALKPSEDEGCAIEIVHYIGFGQREPDGTAKLAFADGDEDTWRSAADVFDWVAKSNARVLVVQLMLPPWNRDYEPIRPHTFLGALTNRVNAVIFTRFPVHPRQCHAFNDAFYRVLGRGGSVEAAVQQARIEVHRNEYFGDAAGFGSFTLITGPRADTRLTTPPVASDPLGGGSKQAVGTAQPSSGPSGREGVSEAFTR
jgi:hypothetical protein